MACTGSTAEPCIHSENCHHYRPAPSPAMTTYDEQPVAQMLISMLQTGEVTVLRTGDVSKLKRFFLR